MKNMKSHKAPGLSGLVEEMIQATGDIGFMQWYHERRLYPRGQEVNCAITNLQRERGSNGVWILQRN